MFEEDPVEEALEDAFDVLLFVDSVEGMRWRGVPESEGA